THIESAFMAGKAVNARVRRISLNKTVTDEAAVLGIFHDGINRTDHARITGGHEKDQRHNEQRGIEIIAAVKLREGVPLFVPALGHYLFIDAVALLHPSGFVCGKRALVSQADAAVKRHPTHNLGIDKMLFTVAHLPDAGVWKSPVVAKPVEAIANFYPDIV